MLSCFHILFFNLNLLKYIHLFIFFVIINNKQKFCLAFYLILFNGRYVSLQTLLSTFLYQITKNIFLQFRMSTQLEALFLPRSLILRFSFSYLKTSYSVVTDRFDIKSKETPTEEQIIYQIRKIKTGTCDVLLI